MIWWETNCEIKETMYKRGSINSTATRRKQLQKVDERVGGISSRYGFIWVTKARPLYELLSAVFKYTKGPAVIDLETSLIERLDLLTQPDQVSEAQKQPVCDTAPVADHLVHCHMSKGICTRMQLGCHTCTSQSRVLRAVCCSVTRSHRGQATFKVIVR